MQDLCSGGHDRIPSPLLSWVASVSPWMPLLPRVMALGTPAEKGAFLQGYAPIEVASRPREYGQHSGKYCQIKPGNTDV